ncbi:hypothetical protein ACC743_38330, partial [Rhizobium ruizarguesonis]
DLLSERLQVPQIRERLWSERQGALVLARVKDDNAALDETLLLLLRKGLDFPVKQYRLRSRVWQIGMNEIRSVLGLPRVSWPHRSFT